MTSFLSFRGLFDGSSSQPTLHPQARPTALFGQASPTVPPKDLVPEQEKLECSSPRWRNAVIAWGVRLQLPGEPNRPRLPRLLNSASTSLCFPFYLSPVSYLQ